MKKALAVLLAVVMAFSACAVCVWAEDDGETAAGTVYTIPSTGLGRINVKAKNDTDEVLILQGGDAIEYGTVTANTSETKFRRIEVIYYPDAASIKATNIKNIDWKDNVVPKYNLDSDKWQLGEGQTAADLMAKSPNYFKTFYSYKDYFKDDPARAVIVGLGDIAHARDSAGVDRGDLEKGNPIDFELSGAKFLGWALYKYDTGWKANGTGTLTVQVYALWERGAAPEEKPDDKPDPTEPTEYATPIQETLAKWLAKIAEIFDWLKVVNAVPGALSLLLDGAVRDFFYNLFGIEA